MIKYVSNEPIISKYTIKEPMPQFGKDVARVVNVPDEMVKKIRADAIDDFTKRLKAECRKHYVDCDPYFGGIVDSILYEDEIDEIAEQLKEQICQ